MKLKHIFTVLVAASLIGVASEFLWAVVSGIILFVYVWGFSRGVKTHNSVTKDFDEFYAPHMWWLRIAIPVVAVITWFSLLKCSGHAIELNMIWQFAFVAFVGWLWSYLPIVALDLISVFLPSDQRVKSYPPVFVRNNVSPVEVHLAVPLTPPRLSIA